LGRLGLPTGLAVLGRLANPIVGRARSRAGRRLEIEEIRRFEPWVDGLFASVRERWRRCFVRNAEYLNWRFIDVPHHDYRPHAIRREGRNVGYFVVGITEKLHTQLGFIADVLVEDDALLPAVQGRALELLVDRGVDACLQLAHGGLAPVGASLRNGFLPAP